MLKGKGLAETVVRVADREIRELKRAYAEGARGEAIALISSSGLLEIAVRDGNAAQELRLGVGTILTVR
jgi:S-adenosylmethionine hydrolase